MSDDRKYLDLDALVDQIAEKVADRVAVKLAETTKASITAWIGPDEAAEYLACPRSRIYDLVASGRLSCARDGRRMLFQRAWLDAALDLSVGGPR